MKKLEDLKKELLQDKVNSFYVFYGEDFGIRKHYINKISTYFNNLFMLSIVGITIVLCLNDFERKYHK